MLDFWIKFWSVFFFMSLTIFALLSVCVAIGGFFNILDLFRTIKKQHELSDDKQNTQNT
jgi:hypothetical protein